MGNVGESETKTMFIIDIYGISSQHFDTYLKPLLFLTKLNRADLVVFAFSDYKFAENQNDLRSPDFQDFRFLDVWSNAGQIKQMQDKYNESGSQWVMPESGIS